MNRKWTRLGAKFRIISTLDTHFFRKTVIYRKNRPKKTSKVAGFRQNPADFRHNGRLPASAVANRFRVLSAESRVSKYWKPQLFAAKYENPVDFAQKELKNDKFRKNQIKRRRVPEAIATGGFSKKGYALV
ncbi:MAG: hypothetical protein GX803_07155 [Lentisphaerae bacterium]|nr:hypothetical protein [Lentisphaerota bacterium]